MRREATLEEYVKRLNEKSLWSALRKVYEKTRSGELRLVDPKPPKTLVEYMLRLDYSLWFWTTTSLVFLTIVAVYTTNILPQLTVLRYFLGTLYTLYLPGYVLIEALYPEENALTPLERLALSVGLSLAITPLIGLVLNYTPWGIRLNPIITSLAIYTLGINIVALTRKYGIYKLARVAQISSKRTL